jgi:hypothetical protein
MEFAREDVPVGVISLLSICLSRSRISYRTAPKPQSTGVLSSGYRVFLPTWTEGGSESKVSPVPGVLGGISAIAGVVAPD